MNKFLLLFAIASIFTALSLKGCTSSNAGPDTASRQCSDCGTCGSCSNCDCEDSGCQG